MINSAAPATPARPGPPQDQAQDQAAQPVPAGIAELLNTVRILSTYARFLAIILPHRGLWRAYTTVARFLASHSNNDTLARIHRAVLRAAALERLLLDRARRGKDLKVFYRTHYQSWPADAADTQDSPIQPSRANVPPRRAPAHVQDRQPISLLPTVQEIEREVRRRSIGQTLAAICLDLGIGQDLCAPAFFFRLYYAVLNHGGNLAGMLMELHTRKAKFDREDWNRAEQPEPERTPEGIRQVLGFLIGESLDDPYTLSISPDPIPVLSG